MRAYGHVARTSVGTLALSGAILVASPLRSAGDELFLSEYIDGSGLFNRALEVYNPTGTALDTAIEELSIAIFEDGSPFATSTVTFGATSGVVVASQSTFVVVQFGADSPLIDSADRTTLGLTFDGNDAIALRRDGTIVDVIGQIGFDPGSSGWGTGKISTQDRTLRRNADVCDGDIEGSDPFDPAVEWTGYPQDSFDDVGSHVADCAPTPVTSRTWGRIKASYQR